MRSLSSLLRRVRDCIEANDLWLIHGLAVAKAQRTTFISHTIAVVRGAEHSNTLIPMLEAYPIILNFMRPHQKIQIVTSKELLSNIFAESCCSPASRTAVKALQLWSRIYKLSLPRGDEVLKLNHKMK